MSYVAKASVEISPAGPCFGFLHIADESGKPSILLELDGEADGLVQLTEDHAYELAFSPQANSNVRPRFSSPFIPSRLEANGLTGKLPSSRFVGTATLSFVDVATGTDAFSVAIEVRPRKLEYLTEFHEMLNDLSGVALDLVTTLRSSFTTSMRTNESERYESIQQRLLFLKSICDGQQVLAAVNRIQALPQTALIMRSCTAPISRSVPQSGQLARSLAQQSDRVRLPGTHPLAKRMQTLPRNVSTNVAHETLDTVENRFVKFVIGSISEFLSDAATALSAIKGADRSLLRWLELASKSFREVSSHSFFKGIGNIHMVPIGSPALQRKPGYKQVLDVWLRFNSANQLNWKALDEVFAGGQRDAALLYEYWCFFIVRDAVLKAFEIQNEDLSQVLRLSDDKLSITLKSGEEAAVTATFIYSGRRFGINLSYQKVFGPKNLVSRDDYVFTSSDVGTWSKRMDPDFTLSIWPIPDGSEPHHSAADHPNPAHLLFDAKYRVVVVNDNSGDSTKQRLRAKGDDLDKMHAYLGSIRRSVGAYAIFPGDVTEFFCCSDDILPSVGYIGVRPGDSGAGKERLRQHLLRSMELLNGTWFKTDARSETTLPAATEDHAVGEAAWNKPGAGH